MEKIVSLCKRRGFIYPGSEIYGGLAGTYDYGPLGVGLKNNLKNLWWRNFVTNREDMFGLDAAIIMNTKTWEASGHVAGFTDPLADGQSFNTMFATRVGAGEEAQTAYLRPETAQGIFVNFKNIVDSFHPKLPFGIAQIGKAFRNEIAPRDFIFRLRELEQMEVEYFVKEEEWEKYFMKWRELILDYFTEVGLIKSSVHELEVPDGERAHYSTRTIDFEFDFPFGRKELSGLAYRTDYDLKQHQEFSKQDLTYFDEENKIRFLPHVIEPSLGLDRILLAVICDSYREDELGGEKRTYLAFNKNVAPVACAVFPLLKNKPDLMNKAHEIYQTLKKENPHRSVVFDGSGSIGKRYRRQDEIGTPLCVTVDFQTLEDDTVTVRERDTGEQVRQKVLDLGQIL
ncbi:glycine--tRNA ligase [Candidatus Nomurabacteria bacterium]|nr:glycine--tRNA ligase [Candidatus Nomurabacteria bacterium]